MTDFFKNTSHQLADDRRASRRDICTEGKKRLPGLDGLRAWAVFLVFLFHRDICAFGWVGVQIFFTLSGFLITRLLDRERTDPLGCYLGNFYGRRALRIFPVYFALILVIVVTVILKKGIGMSEVYKGLPFAATYTFNFWHASNSYVHSRFLSHFWSLCVEEQFYLLWPFVIYYCPLHRLKQLLAAVFLAGPCIRMIIMWILTFPGLPVHNNAFVALYVLTPTHLDAFAVGGFFALFPIVRPLKLLWFALALLVAAGAMTIIFSDATFYAKPATLRTLGYPFGLGPGYGYIWGYSIINLMSAALIASLLQRPFFTVVFDNLITNYLGKISYGLYLFHYPIQAMVDGIFPDQNKGYQILLQVILTVSVAAASFHFFETRFTNMKDRWFALHRAQDKKPES